MVKYISGIGDVLETESDNIIMSFFPYFVAKKRFVVSRGKENR